MNELYESKVVVESMQLIRIILHGQRESLARLLKTGDSDGAELARSALLFLGELDCLLDESKTVRGGIVQAKHETTATGAATGAGDA